MSDRVKIKIICRQAEDDFYALLVAQGMENARASVFSISHNGMHKRSGAMVACSKFVVWAKYNDALTNTDLIDEAIDKMISETFPERDDSRA